MGKFDYNGLKNQKEEAPKFHPEGSFEFKISSYEEKESKTGRPMLVLDCKSSAGKIKKYILVDGDMKGLFIFLNQIKYPKDDIETFEPARLIGKKFFADVCENEDGFLELKKIKGIEDNGGFPF